MEWVENNTTQYEPSNYEHYGMGRIGGDEKHTSKFGEPISSISVSKVNDIKENMAKFGKVVSDKVELNPITE